MAPYLAVSSGARVGAGAAHYDDRLPNPFVAQRNVASNYGRSATFEQLGCAHFCGSGWHPSKVDDAEGDFWRRMHRVGHGLMRASGGNVDTFRRRRLHSFAGHIARATDSAANVALHTRSLAWWRAFQGKQLLKHPQRFYAWRWEEQLTSHYGEEASFFIDEAVGWMRHAENRVTWKSLERAFVERQST